MLIWGNFIDTAELYGTYNYIKKQLTVERGDIGVSTKCYAYNRKVEKSLKALNELVRIISIFFTA